MHRYFFSLRVAVLVVLAGIAVASVDLFVNGFVVVSDPDHVLASGALVSGAGERRPLREFASGYWATRPRQDAAVKLTCRTGREVAAGYATRGVRTSYTVRADDCAAVAGRAARA
ncbi:hypothetical protein [Sphingomonas qomolangmaensis]|uniref:UrcA family protein n=1 Tax=Sphingomonas qomolangmaensis TaxID=2918765 RepID=A0ABY5LE44_9SPHN|nr:hypothetical protein [Sphingomonas qomolangmaensis]UUL84120.1 hypothetical protein NMP03_08045 [Sphingomonas qomolangmaensis]